MRTRSSVFEVDIDGQEEDAPEAKVVRTMPNGLDQHLTRHEWDQFCSSVDQALVRYTNLKRRTRYLNWAIYLIFAALFIVILIHTVFALETKEGGSSSCNNEDSDCNDAASGSKKFVEEKHGIAPAIIILPLFVIILTVWGKLSLSSAHDESLHKVRQVCWKFSKTKTNMIVHLVPRYIGKEEDTRRCDSSLCHSTRCNPDCHEQKLWYIEFWFSSRGVLVQSMHVDDFEQTNVERGDATGSNQYSYELPREPSSLRTTCQETASRNGVTLLSSTSMTSAVVEKGDKDSTTDKSIDDFLDSI